MPKMAPKGDRLVPKPQIALSGEQYEQLPESNNIEDRRYDPPMSDTESATITAAERTKDSVFARNRYRPPPNNGDVTVVAHEERIPEGK